MTMVSLPTVDVSSLTAMLSNLKAWGVVNPGGLPISRPESAASPDARERSALSSLTSALVSFGPISSTAALMTSPEWKYTRITATTTTATMPQMAYPTTFTTDSPE